GLAGLDHVDVEAVEALGVLAEGFAERAAGLHVINDVQEGVLERPALHLAFEDLEAAQDGEAGVLENGELPREGAGLLGGDAADREGLLLAAGLCGGGLLPLLSPSGVRDP